MLFLADIPDQVQILTLYGKLKMGFHDASGQEVVFTVPTEPGSGTVDDAADGRPRDAVGHRGRRRAQLHPLEPADP